MTEEFNLLNENDVRKTFGEMLTNAQQHRLIRVQPFSGEATSDVAKFIEDYEMMASDYRWSDSDRLKKLHLYLQGNARDWFKINMPKLDNWETVKKQLEKFFMPTNYKEHLMQQLRNRKQQTGEPVLTYILEKQVLCHKLNPNMDQDEIFDKIYSGMDGEISSRLYEYQPKDIDDFIEQAKRIEHGNSKLEKQSEISQLRIEMKELVSTLVEAISNRQNISGQYRHPPRISHRTNENRPVCWNCNRPGHTRINCPDLQSTPVIHPPRNHHNTQWNRQNQGNQQPENVIQPRFRENTTNEVIQHDRSHPNLLIVPGVIEGIPAMCLIDPGSTVSMINDRLASQLTGIQPYIGGCVRAVNGGPVRIRGKVNVSVRLQELIDPITIPALISSDLSHDCLLGNDFNQRARLIINCANMSITCNPSNAAASPSSEEIANFTDFTDTETGMIPLDFAEFCGTTIEEAPKINLGKNLCEDEKVQANDLLNQYRGVFADDPAKLGHCTAFYHRINTSNFQPVRTAPYRYSWPIREFINTEVNKMLELGVVKHSKSPYSSPVVVVGKKDGSKRLCVDLRKLNAITKKDVYPLPNIDDLLATLVGSKFFCTLDLNSGYWQISVHPDDVEKTAFCTQDGFYEFTRMPFGLCNAPATFQRTMDVVLAGLKYRACLVYLDDIVVFGSSFNEMLNRLDAVLKAIQSAGLTLKPSKCYLGIEEVQFLGHIITKDGIATDPIKINAITSFPTPRNVTEIRSFVGLAGYYRKFILRFATIARPLTQLTRKNVHFIWSLECDQAFHALKHKLTHAPILTHFDPQKSIELHCDASRVGIGAALMQRDNDGVALVWVISRLLTETEKRYPITEQEALSIVWSLKKLRTFLLGINFSIYTDHKALCWLMQKKDLSDRLTRWALAVQEYNFTIIYKPGINHHVPDYLSRYTSILEARSDEDENHFVNNIVTISGHNLQKKQSRDRECKLLIQAILNPEDHQSVKTTGFTLYEDILHKLVEDETGPKLVPCIPKSLINETLYVLHDDPVSGHLGVNKTLQKAKVRYYWPNMVSDIKEYVKTCRDCQGKKQECQPSPGLLCPIEVGGPFERIGMDLLGPFPRTESGNTTIIVATDYLTRWAECRALPNGSSASIATFVLENIICRFGAPNVFLTDRGKAFQSRFIEDLYRLVGATHAKTSAYHPATNGLTERFNKTLATMLSMYVNTKHSDWDRALNYVCMAYNTSQQASTKFSPFFLLHGFEAKLPTSLIGESETLGVSEASEYGELLETFLNQKRDLARQNLQSAQLANKQDYDRRHRPVVFTEGEKVLVYTPQRKKGRAEKLLHFFRGPFVIKERRGLNSYLIHPEGEQTKLDYVHVSRLKPYTERTLPVISDEENTDDEFYETSDQLTSVDPLIGIEAHTEPNTEEMQTNAPESSDPETVEISLPNPVTDEFIPEHATPEEPSPPGGNEQEAEQAEPGTQPAPRRSTRQRKAPDRLSYAAFTPLILLTIVTLASAGFEKAHPVLWRKSAQPVIKGFREIDAEILFDKPCEVFSSSLNNTNYQLGYIVRWCERSWQEDFLWPLTKMCDTDFEVQAQRTKRFAISTLVLGITAIVSIFSLGLGAASMSETLKNKDEIDHVRNLMEKQLMQTQILKHATLTNNDATRKLIENLQDVTKKVNNLSRRMEEYSNTVPLVSHLNSLLVNRIKMARIQMQKIDQEWKESKISHTFFELFNITLPCGDNCDISSARALKCFLDTKKQRVNFNFLVSEKSPELLVLEADPFILHAYDPRGGEHCKLLYSGTRFVLYNNATSCLSPLLVQSLEKHHNIILSPENLGCDVHSAYNTSSNWRQYECRHQPFLTESQVTQIKPFGGWNFIYCSGFNIWLYNRTLACPVYPFKVSATATFTIGNTTYDFKRSHVVSTMKVDPSVTEKINFLLTPDLHLFDYDETIKQLKETKRELESIPANQFMLEYNTNIFLLASVIIIIATLIIYLIRKRMTTRRTNLSPGNLPDPNEQREMAELGANNPTANSRKVILIRS